jgi:hypothetical protein
VAPASDAWHLIEEALGGWIKLPRRRHVYAAFAVTVDLIQRVMDDEDF